METFEGTAAGKVILLGEHAVVHGTPALVASLDQGARATGKKLGKGDTKRLEIFPGPDAAESRGPSAAAAADDGSELGKAFGALLADLDVGGVHVSAHIEIPTGVGLGGSAALGVAIARATLGAHGHALDPDRVHSAAQAWERVFHDNPSGIDAAAAMSVGCIRYQRPDTRTPIRIPEAIHLALGVAGPPASTKEMVRQVAEQLRSQKISTRRILDRIAWCVEQGQTALESGSAMRLGQLFDECHQALRSLDLSTPELEHARTLSEAAGALGSKLTGSGGGGCVVAVCEDPAPVLKRWREAGLPCFQSTLGRTKRSVK